MNDDPIASSRRDDEKNNRVKLEETRRPTAKPRSLIPQVSLLTLLLGIALIAVWLAWWQAGQSIARLERQLPGLRKVARELKVEDPSQFAVVEKIRQWNDENICDIHIPANQSYRLCLAMDAIDEDGFADPLKSVSLPAGKHQIEIRYKTEGDESTVRVLTDNETVLEESRPKDWEPHAGSTGGMPFSQSRQYPADEPLVLFRRQFMVRKGPNNFVDPTGPGAGILVWVESEKAK